MVSPFTVDTFFPAFYAIADHFKVSTWAVQQALTVYMLPMSAMSLVQGPLSDAVGRRRVVLGGLAIYTVASIGCTLSLTFGMLLAFRVMQGLSAGVGVIVGRAVIRDLYEGHQAQKLMSITNMIFAVAPAVAPVVGGYMHLWFGWRGVFGFMVLIGAALLIGTYKAMPETHPPERRTPLRILDLARGAGRVLVNREFVLLAVAMAASFATVTTFIGAAPAVVLKHWHLGETQFAYLFVPLIGGFFAGSLISSRTPGRVRPHAQGGVGLVLTVAGSASMLLLQASLDSPPLLLQELCLSVSAFGIQLAGPPLILRMIDLFPGNRGAASSVQSCVTIAIGGTVFGFVAPFLAGSMLTLAQGSLCCAALAFTLWLLARPPKVAAAA